MKFTKSKDHNPNYLAKLVYIDEFRPHPNADKLKLCTVEGCNISTSIDSQAGVYIYFPLECAINSRFLKMNNLYRDSSMNQDTTKSGFFEETGRVKCIKLRGIYSEGIIMPLNSLSVIFPNLNGDFVNTEFDTIDDELFVWKYVPKIIRTPGAPGSRNRTKNRKATQLNIKENQFRFHIDTIRLEKSIHNINQNDLIQISWKEHGTSAIFCNLLTKTNNFRCKQIVNKITNTFFGNSLYPDYDYYKFCASRKVIKDGLLNPGKTKGYYNYDIWNLAFEIVKEFLQKGMSIYAEIVGYMPDGKIIQKDYDYKCIYDPKTYKYSEMSPKQMYDAKLFDIVVYRITYTNVDGKVYEWSTQQIQEFCKVNELHAVKELYYGLAENLFPEIKNSSNWGQEFIDKLRNKYLEKKSILCNNSVPEEGIVIRREVNDIDVYKLKALAFLERETKNLDKGIVDIESEQ